MKKLLSIFSLLVVFSLTTHAQQKVALHSNGTTTIFSSTTPLIDAYNAAIAGDTIYVSGGSFELPATVDKALVLIGAGFYPEFTSATQSSIITNDFSIGENADGLYIEGFEMQDLNKRYDVKTDNFTLIRCKINGNVNTSDGMAPTVMSENGSFIHCIFQNTLSLRGYTDSILINSTITNRTYDSVNNTIQNNIFFYTSPSWSQHVITGNSNIIENNIFHNATIYIINSAGNIFRNNVFAVSNPALGGAIYDINNYKGVDLSTVYISQSGNTFSYTDNYQLQGTASSIYLGVDGTQVGIYGGLLPYKDGALPMNPHISAKTISTSTDGNGLLNISITVKAQQQ